MMNSSDQPSIVLETFPQDREQWTVRAIGELSIRERDHLIDVYLAPSGVVPQHDGDFVRATVPLGVLPALKVGSRWRQGILCNRADPVNVVCTSLCQPPVQAELQRNQLEPFFGSSTGWLPGAVRAHGHHVNIDAKRLRPDGTLSPCFFLIPCPTVFASFYGRSSRLARLLAKPDVSGADHPGTQSAWSRRLWLERMQNAEERVRSWFDAKTGVLTICLSDLVDDASAKTLAWLFKEEVARQRAQDVGLHLGKWNKVDQPAHLRADLPFSRPWKMEVEGMSSADGSHFLVTRIVDYRYALEEVRQIAFDRENDSRHAPIPPGVKVKKRRGGQHRQHEAANPDGKSVSTSRPPRADQRAATWEIPPDADVFPDLPAKKLPKSESKSEPQPRDLPADEADEELGVGEGSYIKEAVARLEVQPGPMNSALEDWHEEEGFAFFLLVLRWLAGMGWQVSPAASGKGVFTSELRLHPGKRRHATTARVFGVKIAKGSLSAFIFESEHRGSNSTTPSRSGTVLAAPKSPQANPELVAATIFDLKQQAGNVAGNAGVQKDWLIVPVRHQWKPKKKVFPVLPSAGTLLPLLPAPKRDSPFDPARKHAYRLQRHIQKDAFRSLG